MTLALTLGLAGGLAVAAFFAACEGAFFALAPPAEGEEGRAGLGGRVAARLLSHRDRLQRALALGHVLAVVWVGALAWGTVRRLAPGAGWVAWGAAGLATGTVALIAGEVAPRVAAGERPGPWTRRAAVPILLWGWVVTPLTALFGALAAAVERLVGPAPAARPLTSEDVRSIVAETSERAELEAGERQMITSIFGFGETTVREVMTPRPDVFAIEAAGPLEEAVRLVGRAEHSRVPAYRESLDDIAGVLYAKDLLTVLHGHAEPPATVEPLLREATFVPEAKKIDDLLREFQAEQIHLAVVVDEYGGTAGIVTLEDVLEELVGEIQDEYDREEPLVEPLPDGALRLDGRLDADDFNDLTGAALATEGVETIGGIVARELGHVAEPGERVTLDGWALEVEEVEGKRILKVRAEREERPEESPAGDEEGA